MKKFILAVSCLFLINAGGAPAHAIDGLKYHSLIDNYYNTQSISSLWLDRRGNPNRNTDTLITYLENSWQHGLKPDNYHLQDIKNYLDSDKNVAPRFFDQMISDAYLRYVRDMTGMRIDASLIEQNAKYWRRAIDTKWLLDQAASDVSMQSLLDGLEPQGPLYGRLKEELVAVLQKPEDERPPLILTQTKTLHPGSTHREFVPVLRKFLNVPAEDWQKNVYDDELVQAVVRFQQNNNLKADGIVGPQTLRLMNKTPRDKVHQILANMERLRWLDPQKPEKYILVNIPSATLWAIENGTIAHEMPVIVGRKQRPTLSFTSEITGVRYNPTWTVPKTIKKEDYLPLLKKDATALISKGIDIKEKTDDGWISVDPTLINWATVTDKTVGQYMMVQNPGPTNPLGQIRILMPNQYNIYLHDTSTPEYFRSSDRTVSSGCVRMKDPEAIANFILSDNSNWDETFTQRMLAKGKMTDISAQNRIPVYLLYLTIWINEDGSLTYGPDTYEWDTLMISQLYNHKKLPAYNFSVKNTNQTLAYIN